MVSRGEGYPPRARSPAGASRMAVTSSVFLNVSNIEKSLEFYRSIGFRVARTYKNDAGVVAWADLALQGAEFGLGHIPSNDDPAFRQWVGTPLGAGVIVYFTVPNVDRYHKLAREAGATIEMDLVDRPYGRLFTLNDPDGYTISFIQEKRSAAPAKKLAKKARSAGKKSAKKKAARRSR